VNTRRIPGRFAALILCVLLLVPAAGALAAPYAAMVIDARSGEVLHSRNADTRLHPASLTKMMTLYVAFDAIRRGEISLDTVVTISRNAAAEPPSKLGLRAGQKIRLRYLIRAAAVRSANDAATAIGEAISGSEAAFAARMTATAKALGMNDTTFKNAHGLTAAGHLSTARDMTTLGRRMFYDWPEYYNLFSRRTADAGVATVPNTNRRFLRIIAAPTASRRATPAQPGSTSSPRPSVATSGSSRRVRRHLDRAAQSAGRATARHGLPARAEQCAGQPARGTADRRRAIGCSRDAGRYRGSDPQPAPGGPPAARGAAEPPARDDRGDQREYCRCPGEVAVADAVTDVVVAAATATIR
jgi:hypothetical protein